MSDGAQPQAMPGGAWRRLAPWIWLLCVLGIALHQWQFWHQDRLQTDLFALLPADEREPGAERALHAQADAASRQLLVLVGAAQWADARAAAERFDADWRRLDPTLQDGAGVGATGADAAIAALRPWRDRLLLPGQLQWLRGAGAGALDERAMATLHQGALGWRVTDWINDPLGLWPAWWARQLAGTPVRPREGWLALQNDGWHWVVLSRQVAGAAFTMSGDTPHGDAIDEAERRLQAAAPAARVLRAGVPLHAEAAAARGSAEMNVIGWGSLAAVLALVWAGFRSLRPILCIALSLAVGTAAALSVTALVFERVHVLTLVFGASLVGVAEDFGIHYFASRAAAPKEDPAALMRRLWPGLALALATSVVGYAAMAVVPVPGLRQMAVFSAAGLVAAFLTVDCWFPALAGRGRAMTPLAERVAGSVKWRPAPPRTAAGRAAALILGLIVLAGAARLDTRDDVRALQTANPALMQQQREVQRLLQGPVLGQFFVVGAPTESELLAREQALVARLRPLAADGVIGGWRALSDWVPPPSLQQESARVVASAEDALLARLGRTLDEDFRRAPFASTALTLATLFEQPVASAMRPQWLGDIGRGEQASVVLVHGLRSLDDLPRLAAAAQGLPGVRWVDQVGRWSGLLARYRGAMSGVLVAGFLAVGAALWLRFRRDAWRAWLPSVLACAAALGAQGWLGQPLELFNVLALIILLGIGVDYGIFLVEHRADGSAWLAVVLGAASTLLSFGLLALSSTPALRGFGLTMAIGVTTVVLLSPVFVPRPPASR